MDCRLFPKIGLDVTSAAVRGMLPACQEVPAAVGGPRRGARRQSGRRRVEVPVQSSEPMKIYTRTGDDGSTGMLYGGRIAKDDTGPEAYGTVDEAVSALGVARALTEGESAAAVLRVQRELFVVGAELATGAGNRDKLTDGVSRVTAAMVESLESAIDELVTEVGMPAEFIVPGGNRAAAAIDLARSVVRRAERRTVTHCRAACIEDSHTVPYLNRLADYLYMLARATEGTWIPSREE